MVLVALAFGAGVRMVENERRGEELWMPTDSEAAADKDLVDRYYDKSARVETALLVSRAGDMLTVANLEAMLEAYNQLAAATAEYNGETLTWESMCNLVGSTCQAINVLEPFSYVVPSTRAEILAIINSHPDGDSRLLNMTYGSQTDAEKVLGQVSTADNHDITQAKAAKLVFMVRNDQVRSSDGGWESPKAEAWEKSWLDVAASLSLAGIDLTRYAGRTRSDEFGSAIQGDVVLINVAVMLLLGYCMLSIGKLRRGETRFTITLIGVTSIGLAAISGIGLVNGYAGVMYTPLHSVLSFLLLGLGVDDMFVICAAFDATDPADPIPKRLSNSLRHSGSNVTLTSLTDTLAFLIGSSTIIPALRAFALTAGVCIFFIWVYQVLLFAPCLAIDERRRAAGRNDLWCCCSSCCCDRCICAGKPLDKPGSSEDGHQDSGAVAPSSPSPSPSTTGHDNLEHPASDGSSDDGPKNCLGLRVGLIRRLLVKTHPAWVLDPRGNTVGVLLFAAIGACGVAGLARLEVDSNVDNFLPPGSYARDYVNADNEYFNVVGVLTHAYTMNPSYWERASEMASLRSAMAENSYIVSSTVDSWYHNLVAYNTANACSTATEAEWYSCLDTFLASSSGSQYRRQVVFEDNGATGTVDNPIAISRISANHKWAAKSSVKVSGMDSFRDTVSAYNSRLDGSLGEPFGYSYAYPAYEGYKVIQEEAIRNMGLALLAIMVTVVVLVPSLVISGLIFVAISSTVIEVGGFVHWWGLTLDNVTVIMLVVSVGISVDYAAHMGHSFYSETGDPSERAAKSVVGMGPCVWHGFFSTFLAIVVLATSESYVFSVFFKELFLASVFGIFNGLVALPILLKLLGGYADLPASNNQHQGSDEALGPADVGTAVHLDGSTWNSVDVTTQEDLKLDVAAPEHSAALKHEYSGNSAT
eukprot:TRINITY_DN15482_c0_g12_i2.p1 TRINITY_DN15482_c0_g12~~TRINITY_DN15482_c0_g12_i2.p1  ORF type:complete len:926 (-),score=215.55 TRINITY_DN15482_c0_g12_i2:272-3049(-)